MKIIHRVFKENRRAWPFFLTAICFVALFFSGVSYVQSSCISLDDQPVEVLSLSAPGIILFMIDDSGSMDWTVLTTEFGGDGVFKRDNNKNYEYIFTDPGDDAYAEGSSSNADHLEDTYADRMLWKSQYAGYNRMYYNPNATYAPWPRWSTLTGTDPPNWPDAPNADPDNPRSNPIHSANVLNMNAVWENFLGTDINTIVTNNGFIIDNSDTAVADNNVYIDNLDARFSYTPSASWQTSTSVAGYWPTTGTRNYRQTKSTGSATATWSVSSLPAGPGDYDVYAWWPASTNFTQQALFTINNDAAQIGPLTMNQEANGGTWNLLASNVHFDGVGDSVKVTRNVTNNSNDKLVADAIRLVPKFPIPTAKLFTSTGPWTTGLTSTDDYGANYQNAQTVSATPYTATWETDTLDTNNQYDVYIHYVANATQASTNVQYVITHGNVTDPAISVSQRINGGQWNRIAEGLPFTTGTGIVTLTQTVSNASTQRACADAVAFVPIADIEIIRAHYFTQNTNGIFLVNLKDDFQYFKFVDGGATPDNKVQKAELTELTAEQAAAAGIVTGRTFHDERLNFANWYSFYSRRELTAKAAIARVVDTMQGVYIGLSSINSQLNQYALPVAVTYTDPATEIDHFYDSSDTILRALYGLPSNPFGTPLRTALVKAGQYFQGTNTALTPGTLPVGTNAASFPYYTQDNGGSCQASYCILMTDGFDNGGTPSVGNADGDCNTNYDCGVYDDSYSNTLADVAMYYYERDLQSDLYNDVSTNYIDLNTSQHMVTYTLSFGLTGTIDRSLFPNCGLGGACPAWTDPSSGNSQKIDDLYHAAINGRGTSIVANSPEDLVTALEAMKSDIELREFSAAAVATSSVSRQVGTRVFQGVYMPTKWTGDLVARSVNVNTGELGNVVWRSTTTLDATNPDDRNIISSNGATGIPFRYASLSAAQKTTLQNTLALVFGSANDTLVQRFVTYIRGDDTYEKVNGGSFRSRDTKLGDIVNSEPFYFEGVVYIGANDGMLHAFDANSGEELWAYLPNIVYSTLPNLANPYYSHKYFVNGTPYVKTVGEQKLLVCGLGKGGKGYFGLDVTDPITEANASSAVLWEYTNDNDLGYTYSNAYIVHTKAAGWVVIFGNGYDSVNQEAILFVLNAETGAVIKKIPTGVFTCNGLSDPAIIDPDVDGNIDYVFAGDLLGNMWKFDFRGNSVSDWSVAYKSGSTPQPLIQVGNAVADAKRLQKIMVEPDVMRMSSCEGGLKGYLVAFGTGKYESHDDVSDLSVQSLYGIYDWGPDWESKTNSLTGDDSKYLGTFQSNRTLSNQPGKVLIQQTQVGNTNNPDWLAISDNSVIYYSPYTNTGTAVGWYFDLPVAGERCVRDPMIREGVAIFISNQPYIQACTAGGNSVLYQLNSCTGGRTATSQFDVNANGVIDADLVDFGLTNPIPPSGKKINSILFEPTELEDHLYINTSTGAIDDTLVRRSTFGVQYWRVIE